MAFKKRVTQQSVAERAGVHRTTVALALKRHPSIPVETRERILNIVKEMGYSPDPMLSALAAYRSAQRPPTFHGTIAWLVNSIGGFQWNRQLIYHDYYQGAKASALRYGYKIEVFDLAGKGVTPSLLARILQARNITGILLCPQPRARMEMDFPWECFSAVTFGYTLKWPRLHTVTSAHYRHVILLVQQLRQRGYKRIGFVLHDRHDERTDHNYLGAYLATRQFMPVQLAPLLVSTYPDYAQALGAWAKAERPDAVITGSGETAIQNFLQIGLEAPEDIGLVSPGLASADSIMSGINEEPFYIGESAVDILVAMIQRSERGIPVHPQRIHVEGSWVEGKTLRALPRRFLASRH